VHTYYLLELGREASVEIWVPAKNVPEFPRKMSCSADREGLWRSRMYVVCEKRGSILKGGWGYNRFQKQKDEWMEVIPVDIYPHIQKLSSQDKDQWRVAPYISTKKKKIIWGMARHTLPLNKEKCHYPSSVPSDLWMGWDWGWVVALHLVSEHFWGMKW